MKNQPAFPFADTVDNGEKYEPLNTGLTKLEYFSIKCLQGILSNNSSSIFVFKSSNTEMAINYAKELIKQLENDI